MREHHRITEDGKLIFSPKVAKYLLNRNYQIVDIKPDRNDRNKTIFIFRNDAGLNEAILDYSISK